MKYKVFEFHHSGGQCPQEEDCIRHALWYRELDLLKVYAFNPIYILQDTSNSQGIKPSLVNGRQHLIEMKVQSP